MPDVQDGARAVGDREQLARLLQRGGHRFLDQYADAGLQQVAGHVEVLLGRHRHADHVDQADQLTMVAEGTRLVATGDRRRPVAVDVGHADEVGVRQLGVDEHVVLTHVTGAHHAGPQPSVHRHQSATPSASATGSSIPPRGGPHIPWRIAPPMKSMSSSTGPQAGTSSRIRSTARLGASPLR